MSKTQPKPQRRVPRQQIFFTGTTRCKQSHRDECDINQIMRKFERNGVLEHYNEFAGSYGDFTDAPGFHEAQNIVLDAIDMFSTVPSKIRAEFDNDPSKFLTFTQDEKNKEKLYEMGLATRPFEPPKIDTQRVPKEKAAAPPETPLKEPKKVSD